MTKKTRMNGNHIAPDEALYVQINSGYQQTIQTKLYALLAKQTARYTLNDSSSLPVELAEELFRAICYVLGIERGMTDEQAAGWAEADFDFRFNKGIRCIQKKMTLCKKLWHTASQCMPQLENTSLTDTLNSMKTFEKRYDYYFFAHQIPCDIDYQLCLPAPDTFLGVDYLIEWLTRFFIECQLINSFDAGRCKRVLNQHSPDYKGLLINLYDPIAAHALLKIIAGGDVFELELTDEESRMIEQRLLGRSRAETIRLLTHAAGRLNEILGIHSIRAQDYLKQHAASLAHRVQAGAVTLTADTAGDIIDTR